VESSEVVNGIFNNIEEKLEGNLSVVSISLTSTGLTSISLESCFEIDNLLDFNCGASKNLVVKDQLGNLLSSSKTTSIINIEKTSLSTPEDKLYIISCSEEITPSSLGSCFHLNENTDYNLGIISQKSAWSSSSLSNFESRYNNDYNNLRNEIVPSGGDFDFVVFNINTNLIVFEVQGNPPRGTRINAKTFQIDLITSDASLVKHTITIRVW